MSYVDAWFDRQQDRIHVVERVDGRREYREFPANYVFYYNDPRAKKNSRCKASMDCGKVISIQSSVV